MTITTSARPPITAPKVRMAFVNEVSGEGDHTRPLAVMIDVPWMPTNSDTHVCCYSMWGQHSSCCINYARNLGDCTEEQRADLLKHLTCIYGDQLIEVAPIATTATWEIKL